MNYIKRHVEGIEVNQEYGSIIIDTSIKKYINLLCLKNLTTYEGRRIATQKLLGETSNIPIYLNGDICLYPIKSIRDYNTVFINYNEVLSYKETGKVHTRFVFSNLCEITLEVSINIVKKQHARIKKILEYVSYIN